ncbi:MAG: hypothetical protein GY803_28200 [Chloroflexi bacterium]|nr:hypothetical protein [Chloroflexota bacterium]
MSKEQTRRVRNITIWASFLLGIILCVMSLAAELLGLDLTPGFGIVQMFQLLVGVTALTFAVFLFLKRSRPNGAPRSLQADIGVRLAATGLIFAYVAGLSDLIGIGTHVQPNFERPFVGPLQLGGLGLGILTIIAGILLYYTSRGARDASSMEFLINNQH